MKRIKIREINPYIKASFCYLLCNGLGQGMILLSSIVFTRIMSKESYGLYSTYYSMVSILNTIIGANLFNGLNNAYVDFKEDIHAYRASNLVLSSFVFLLVSCVSVFLYVLIGLNFESVILIMALIHAYSFFVITYFNYSANMENRYIAKSVLLILPNFLQVALSVSFIFILPVSGLKARIFGSTFGVALCGAFVYCLMSKGYFRKSINIKYWKYGLAISVPSILSSLSYILMSNSDNLMITMFCGAEETAVYALLYNIGYALVAVMQATNGVLQAWLYRILDINETQMVLIVQKWYLFVYFIISVGVLMVSPEIVKILSPSNYWNFSYIPLFVLGSYLMVMYSFYSTEGLFYKKSGQVSICVLIAAALNIVLNFCLLRFFGGIAAACTSVVSYITLFFLLRHLGQKLHKNLFSLKLFIFPLLLVVGFCILFEMIHPFVLFRYIIFSLSIVGSIIYMIIKKEEWVRIIKK